MKHIFVILCYLFCWQAFAQHNWFNENKIPKRELKANFWTVYTTQWLIYYIDQKDVIHKTASWDNYTSNIFNTTFDKDDYQYNVFKHTLVGNYYYLFYRSRGYSKRDSFLWGFLSSTAFEYTIETLTEPPSHQDLYQTPVYGAILGYYSEGLSEYWIDSDLALLRFLACIINPFRLLPSTENVFFSAQMIGEYKSMGLRYEF